MSTLKISIRVNRADIEYLKEHPVEDVSTMPKRLVPYNETLRMLLSGFVKELKKMRGHV